VSAKNLATVPLICRAHGLPEPLAEFQFHPPRRWRLDYAWEFFRLRLSGPMHHVQVALEVNGGVWNQGRHTRGAGFIRDMAKLNQAQLDGWIVLQCTPQQVASGAIVPMLKEALK